MCSVEVFVSEIYFPWGDFTTGRGVISAKDNNTISKFFEWVTMSVSVRSVSSNPNQAQLEDVYMFDEYIESVLKDYFHKQMMSYRITLILSEESVDNLNCEVLGAFLNRIIINYKGDIKKVRIFFLSP